MNSHECIKIKPTCLLKKIKHELWQCFSIEAPADGILTGSCADYSQSWSIRQGQNDILLPETPKPRKWLFEQDGSQIPIIQQPVRRRYVHIIQSSHHDLGYTDLPSEVVKQHINYLEYAVDCAERTRDYTEEAKFRIVIEQFWSLAAFMKTAPQDKQAKMLKLLQQGQFEVNALFGNMITEVCGSVGLLAALEPAFVLAGRFGIPVRCAEHNDIPGFSWGLARALCDAGLVMLNVGFPQYHRWSGMPLPPYWQEEDLLGHPAPGGFWWESPDGKRLLLWVDHGYNYTSSGSLPTLRADLKCFLDQGYPYDHIRYPVNGASMDNAPYIFDYADTVRQWNQEWDNPRLILSTNSRFFEAIQPELRDLPVYRGEVPCQDYPMGTLSLPHTTALNTYNHVTILQAESLLAMAKGLAGVSLDRCLIDQAQQAILCYDEHTFGFHYPCGPAAAAAKAEKELFALQAAGWIHATAEKAKAEIADRLPGCEEGQILVVFNTTQATATGPVAVLMREYDNLGQDLHPTADGYLKPAQVAGRWHVSPQNDYLDGAFNLIDEAGRRIPYQIDEISSANEPEPFAGERLGLGQGTRRYGFYENPAGIRKTLRFMASDVPALGWKTYILKPSGNCPSESVVSDQGRKISNAYYTISFQDGRIYIQENQTGWQLLDPMLPVFGSLIAKGSENQAANPMTWTLVRRTVGPIRSTLEFAGQTLGHPSIRLTLSLMDGMRQFNADFRISKDATPLLTTSIAFPFAAQRAHFTYDGTLCTLSPAEQILPGSYSDVLAAHGWLRQTDADGQTIICSALDSNLWSFSESRDIYISPAHRCVSKPDIMIHPAPTVEQFTRGGFYSLIDCNNFGTNFTVSNPAQWLMRFCFTTNSQEPDDTWCDSFARQAQQGLISIFKYPSHSGNLKRNSLLTLTGDPVSMLYLRSIGGSYRMAFWNRNRTGGSRFEVHWLGETVRQACRTDAVGQKIVDLAYAGNCIVIDLKSDEIIYCELECEES